MTIYKQIEKKLRNFLWDGSDKVGGSHLVQWDLMTRAKEKGDLGIY